MRSIKPGRGPSMMGGIMGIFAALFGVLWIFIAASNGAIIVVLPGILFVIIAVVQAIYNFKNASGKNRFSTFDITDSSEESDPLNDRFSPSCDAEVCESSFCPYCGTPVDESFEFCNKCGKKLP